MITHDMIGPSDEDLAREVIVVARSIAPCVFSLPNGSEEQKDAISILRRVFKDSASRGSRSVKSQRIGSAAVEYADVASSFEGQPTRALKALCAAAPAAGQAQASFPTERPLQKMWPETYR